MIENINPLAPHALPSFISAPGETDALLVGIGIFLVVVVFLLGVGFLWLHSLPERMAHKSHKLQFEVVAILCLLSLFTHNNALWGAALLLALVDLPDFGTPLLRIANSLERLAGAPREEPVASQAPPVSSVVPTEPAPQSVQPAASRIAPASFAEAPAKASSNDKLDS